MAIYAFREVGTLLYVGESQNVSEKTHGKGKKCHDWRRTSIGRDVEVLVFGCPPPPPDVWEVAGQENASNPGEVIRRAVEAEVVFAYRSRTGALPVEQHELHFQPK